MRPNYPRFENVKVAEEACSGIFCQVYKQLSSLTLLTGSQPAVVLILQFIDRKSTYLIRGVELNLKITSFAASYKTNTICSSKDLTKKV